MQYVGPGKEETHHFQDVDTRSGVLLNVATGQAELVREVNGHPYWDDAELEYYRKQDADLNAEKQKDEARTEAAKRAPLFMKHAEKLRALVRDQDEFSWKGQSATAVASQILQAARDRGDPDFHSFAGAIGTREVGTLAYWLVEPIREEQSHNAFCLVSMHPRFEEALEVVKAIQAQTPNTPYQESRAVGDKLNELTHQMSRATDGAISPVTAYFALVKGLEMRQAAASTVA